METHTPREAVRTREAGWPAILLFLFVSVGILVAGTLSRRGGPLAPLLAGPPWWENLVLFGTLLVLAAGGVVFGMARLRPRDLGLGRSKLLEGAATIAVLWCAIQLIPAAAELALTGTVQMNAAWSTRGVTRVLVWAAVMFLGTALYEEIGFRGFLFPQLYLKLGGTPRRRFWVAALLSQGIFALAHLPGHLVIRNLAGAALWGTMVAQGVVGILLVLVYLRTRNLWIAVGIHGLVNAPTPLVANPVPWEIYLVVLLVAWPRLARRPEHRGLATIDEGGPVEAEQLPRWEPAGAEARVRLPIHS